MDLNNLSSYHADSINPKPIQPIEPDIGASWNAQAWDDIFNTVDIETDEEVTTS